MGFNTTVVVMNDALDDIAADPNFGRNLSNAIRQISGMPKGARVDVQARGSINAAHVVETHHANVTTLVTVGGNLGICQSSLYDSSHHLKETQVELLKNWAKELGFKVSRMSSMEPS